MRYAEINDTEPVSTQQERLILKRRELEIEQRELDAQIIHTLTESQITTYWRCYVALHWGANFNLEQWVWTDEEQTPVVRNSERINRPTTRT